MLLLPFSCEPPQHDLVEENEVLLSNPPSFLEVLCLDSEKKILFKE
jgi:hypothetical protein